MLWFYTKLYNFFWVVHARYCRKWWRPCSLSQMKIMSLNLVAAMHENGVWLGSESCLSTWIMVLFSCFKNNHTQFMLVHLRVFCVFPCLFWHCMACLAEGWCWSCAQLDFHFMYFIFESILYKCKFFFLRLCGMLD